MNFSLDWFIFYSINFKLYQPSISVLCIRIDFWTVFILLFCFVFLRRARGREIMILFYFLSFCFGWRAFSANSCSVYFELLSNWLNLNATNEHANWLRFDCLRMILQCFENSFAAFLIECVRFWFFFYAKRSLLF